MNKGLLITIILMGVAFNSQSQTPGARQKQPETSPGTAQTGKIVPKPSGKVRKLKASDRQRTETPVTTENNVPVSDTTGARRKSR